MSNKHIARSLFSTGTSASREVMLQVIARAKLDGTVSVCRSRRTVNSVRNGPIQKSFLEDMRYGITLSDKLVMAENEIEDYDLEGRTGEIE